MRGISIAAAMSVLCLLQTARAGEGASVKEYSIQVRPFDLKDVRLLDGPLRDAMELDRQYLLSLDVGSLLHTFRVNAGLPSSAKPLGGWEEPNCEVRGHFIGHYLSACALMYASTGDKQLKEKGDAMVAVMAACQQKLGSSGYLSAFPEEFFDRVESGKQVWVPWYTMHKILAGLLEMHVQCGNKQALEVARKMGDWIKVRTDRLSDEQMQKMLGLEHGGLTEGLANLYALTGEEKYLKVAQRFNHHAVLDPASKRQDQLTGLHANTQIPKFTGFARQHELTGDEALKTAARFFWDTVVEHRTYVNGGNSLGEHFTDPEKFSQALGFGTAETCNTYNMLKLTRHLFQWDPQARYFDYYERALYNHILASQHPKTGMMCYCVQLATGFRKEYSNPLDSFWCCTGTGVENHAKYGDSIYFHDAGTTLYVNLFVASELNWAAQGLTLRQETRYPAEGSSKLVFKCEKPVRLTMNIRCPWWATRGFTVAINGTARDVKATPGSYVAVTEEWKTGDTLEIGMPFSLRTEGFRDNPRRLAFFNGPVLLGAEVDPDKAFVKIVAEDGHLLDGVKTAGSAPSTFAGPADCFRIPGTSEGRAVTLKPFYKIHGTDRCYAVYWDVVTPKDWQATEAAIAARQKKMDDRTVDSVVMCDGKSEQAHKLEGEKSLDGAWNGRRFRDAGKWFSYTLKVMPDQPMTLLCTYWRGDTGPSFDVLVDGQKIATQALTRSQPDEFFDVEYNLPKELTAGKKSVTVRFNAGNCVGHVFDCRILK